MNCSKITLDVLACKKANIIKDNVSFWKNYYTNEKLYFRYLRDVKYYDASKNLVREFEKSDDYIISTFDKDFPIINSNIPKKSDKPYILFCRGNRDLLKDLNRNICILGSKRSDEILIEREKSVINALIKTNPSKKELENVECQKKELVIVSDLENNRHSLEEALRINAKVIVVIPYSFKKISDKNEEICDEIIKKGGLIITECADFMDPKENVDKLKSILSKCVILIYGENSDEDLIKNLDFAKKLNIDRYVLFNKEIDECEFRETIYKEKDVKVLSQTSIQNINILINSNLI